MVREGVGQYWVFLKGATSYIRLLGLRKTDGHWDYDGRKAIWDNYGNPDKPIFNFGEEE
jgi:hypothetical protein